MLSPIVAKLLYLAILLVALIYTWLPLSFLTLVALTFVYRFLTISCTTRIKPRAQQTVLITGATSGIGLALAKHLYLKTGFSVVAAYYDTREPGHAELKKLQESRKSSSSNRLLLVELDVRKEQSVSAAYLEVEAALKKHQLQLWAIINNAGLGHLLPFVLMKQSTVRATIETNLLGAMLVARQFLPLLAQNPQSRIINVSSGLGLLPGPNYSVYGATKSALIYFSSVLRDELNHLKVQVISVLPHNFIRQTNIGSNGTQLLEAALKEMSPIERQLFEPVYNRYLSKAQAIPDKRRQFAEARKEGNQAAPGTWIERAKNLLLNQQHLGQSLEESGLLECFEQALTLHRPPEHIFAGNTTFNLLNGSIFLSLPTSCASLIGKIVSPTLHQ